MTAADYPDFQTPQANATQIAATGVPLLHNANLLASNPGQLINPGTIFQPPNFFLTQPSYEMNIEVKTSASATSPFLKVTLNWVDTATLTIMESSTFYVPAGSIGNGILVFGRGPSIGGQLNLQLFNTDVAQTMTAIYHLAQSSRLFTRDLWHWDNEGYPPADIPGYTLPTLPPDPASLGVLSAVTIPASSTKTYLFAPWDGLIQIVSQVTTGSASSLTVNIRPQPDSNFAATPITFQSAGVAPNGTFAGSRAPFRVDVINSATSAIVVNLALWAIR